MSDQYWLSEEQLARIKPYFHLSYGVPWVDDRKVVSGIIQVIRNVGLAVYGRIKPCIIDLYAGSIWASLTGFHRSDRRERPTRPPYDRCHPSESAPHGLQPDKGGASPSYWPHKWRAEQKIARDLRR